MSEEALQELRRAQRATFGALLPALVHRANNCLSVVRGTLEVADPPRELTDMLEEQTATLGRILDCIGRHVRMGEEDPVTFDLAEVAADLVFLLSLGARHSRVPFSERSWGGGAPVRGPRERIERWLVSVAAGLYETVASSDAPERMLAVRRGIVGREYRIVLVGAGRNRLRLEGPLEREADELFEQSGLRWTSRVRGAVVRIAAALPLHGSLGADRFDAGAARRRVLLVQPPGEEAELNTQLLREHGYRVEQQCGLGAGPPEGFDVALVDAAVLGPDGWPSREWLEGFAAVGILGRPEHSTGLPVLEKPIRPAVLLEWVAGQGS